MGFREWVLNLLGGQPKPEEEEARLPSPERDVRDPMEEEAAGLNFYTAIEAHQKWKVRLLAVIEGDSSEGLSVEVIGRDDQCALGKWIYGVGGARFSAVSQFGELKRNHAFFHTCAAGVLEKAQEGQKDAALQALKQGAYARASQDVIRDLAVMYRHATTGG